MASYTQAALVAQQAANAAAPTAPAPVAEKIPPSMARFIDVEGEIPITSVQLDGLVSLVQMKAEAIIKILIIQQFDALSAFRL